MNNNNDLRHVSLMLAASTRQLLEDVADRERRTFKAVFELALLAYARAHHPELVAKFDPAHKA